MNFENKYTFAHCGFAAMRAPFFSSAEWHTYTNRLSSEKDCPHEEAEQIWSARLEKARLLFDRPEVAEALFIASPSFYGRLKSWEWKLTNSEDEMRLAAFERYFNRMCFRPTPFGTFATVSHLQISQDGSSDMSGLLRNADVCRVRRLDGRVLSHFQANLRNERNSSFRLNASAVSTARTWRYVDWRNSPKESREYVLSEIDRHPIIDFIFEKTSNRFYTPADLLEEVEKIKCGMAKEDIRNLIEDLISNNLLISDLTIDSLSNHPFEAFVQRLLHTDKGNSNILQIQALAEEIDKKCDSIFSPEQYLTFNQKVGELAGFDESNILLQVDSIKKLKESKLSEAVVNSVIDDLSVLTNFFLERSTALDDFCQKFSNRYGDQWVQLMHVLDSEMGLGTSSDMFPNLALRKLGISRGVSAVRNTLSLSKFDRFLFDLIGRRPESFASGVLEILEDDLTHVSAAEADLTLDSITAMIQVADGTEGGEVSDRLRILNGLSVNHGVSLLSRFAHGDKDILRSLNGFAEDVMSQSGEDEIHAEISFNVDGKLVNILTRPPIWRARINLVDPSTPSEVVDIPISDIFVYVVGKRVLLGSKSLGKRVIPHLTSAHNPALPANLPAYRFLSTLIFSGAGVVRFSWGQAFDSFERLPRIVFRKTVLSPATWRISSAIVSKYLKGGEVEPKAFNHYLDSIKVPKWVDIKEGDNTLTLYRDDVIDLSQIVRLASKSNALVLQEVVEFQRDDGRVHSPVWKHELLIPFRCMSSKTKPDTQASIQQALKELELIRNQAAGALMATPDQDNYRVSTQEVIYIKLYGGNASIDDFALFEIEHLMDMCLKESKIEKWFYIRYTDPEFHIRLRVFPRRDNFSVVITDLTVLAESLRSRGIVRYYQYDQYERELKRYGGGARITSHETLFWLNSTLSIQLVRLAQHYGVERWKMCVVFLWLFMRELDLSSESSMQIFGKLAKNFAWEYEISKSQKIAIGDLYRETSREILMGISGKKDVEWVSAALRAAADHWQRFSGTFAAFLDFQKSFSAQENSVELDSQIHMLCNRIFESEARSQETFVYDFMERLYRGFTAYQK